MSDKENMSAELCENQESLNFALKQLQNNLEMKSQDIPSSDILTNSRNAVNAFNNMNACNANFENSVVNMKQNSMLNGSASTSVLRNITSVVNIRNDNMKDKQNKYLSVSKIYKQKVQQNETSLHTKTISNVKEVINVSRTGQFHDLKIKSSNKRELSS